MCSPLFFSCFSPISHSSDSSENTELEHKKTYLGRKIAWIRSTTSDFIKAIIEIFKALFSCFLSQAKQEEGRDFSSSHSSSSSSTEESDDHHGDDPSSPLQKSTENQDPSSSSSTEESDDGDDPSSPLQKDRENQDSPRLEQNLTTPLDSNSTVQTLSLGIKNSINREENEGTEADSSSETECPKDRELTEDEWKQLQKMQASSIFLSDIFFNVITKHLNSFIRKYEELVIKSADRYEEEIHSIQKHELFQDKYRDYRNLGMVCKKFNELVTNYFNMKNWDASLLNQKKFGHLRRFALLSFYNDHPSKTLLALHPRGSESGDTYMTHEISDVGIIKGMLRNIRIEDICPESLKKIGWHGDNRLFLPQGNRFVLHGQFINQLPTFATVQKKQSGYRYHIEHGLPFNSQPIKVPQNGVRPIEKYIKEEKTCSRFLNMRLIFDEYYEPKTLQEIAALREDIYSHPSGYEGNLYICYQSPIIETLMPLTNPYFYIPNFFTAKTQINDSDIKASNANVIYEIQVDKSDCTAFVGEKENEGETYLVPCYSHFEYVSHRLENGRFIITIKGANEELHISPFYDLHFWSFPWNSELYTTTSGNFSSFLSKQCREILNKEEEMEENYGWNKRMLKRFNTNKNHRIDRSRNKVGYYSDSGAQKAFDERVVELKNICSLENDKIDDFISVKAICPGAFNQKDLIKNS